jgi:hypothetical protein
LRHGADCPVLLTVSPHRQGWLQLLRKFRPPTFDALLAEGV